MKLSAHAVRRFWSLHAWAGVIGGLVLYVMFLTGAIALFQHPLETWEEPVAQQAPGAAGLQTTLERGVGLIGATPDDVWFYTARDGRGAARWIYVKPGASRPTTLWIDPQSPRLVPERERMSSFLYALHFLWHDATGNWLYYAAGLLAVALLLALVTGVLFHIGNIIRQFHQFRPDRTRRVLWSDMHKVLGVVGLPFQLMYAYTGAFLILAPLVLQGFVGPVFGGDENRAAKLAWATADPGAPGTHGPAAMLSLDELAARARAERPGLDPDVYHVVHHGHADAVVEAWGRDRGTPTATIVVRMRAVDGAVVHVQSSTAGGAGDIARRWINGLHYAQFGGTPLRFLYFVLALATCATILTGNWVWLARRSARSPTRGRRILARLTAGVGAGTLVAVAALLLASRLLPLDWTERGPAEELIFVGALGLCIVWALAARSERGLWWQPLGVAGLLLAPVPLLAARWSSAGLFGSGARIATVVAVDVAILVAAIACIAASIALRRSVAPAENAVALAELPVAATAAIAPIVPAASTVLRSLEDDAAGTAASPARAGGYDA